MPREPKQPLVVSVGYRFVQMAALVVPRGQRDEWQCEWRARIWHRWKFLLDTGEWNNAEKLRLVLSACRAFSDGAWQFASQEAVRNRVLKRTRSPYSCLVAFVLVLLLIATLSRGLPATRELLFSQSGHSRGQLMFIWQHPWIGGGDKGLPDDVVPAWKTHSKLIDKIAGFDARHQPVTIAGNSARLLVVTSEPELFAMLGATSVAGKLPKERGVVLDHDAWVELTRANPKAVGAKAQISGTDYRVAAILPAGFKFLSRQPTVYLLQHPMVEARVFAVAKLKPGVSENRLDRELATIAEDVRYYFLQGQLRFAVWRSAVLTPLMSFGVALFLSSCVAVIVFRVRRKQLQFAFLPQNRRATVHRTLFFAGKTGLALACVFTGCLEWSRSESSVLLASRDPGSGPFLIWLYVLGTMGVLFWAVADQRARCRVCLQLLAFPVRIGRPGCLLLDWSGTELLCSKGHGLLHVPHMAPSWDEEAERWISLDDSWQGLFAHDEK